MRFEMGQQIWIGNFSPLAPAYETCPDCGGTGRLRVTFHDETQVSIECKNCAPGLEAPTGRVRVYRISSTARLATVCGFESNQGKTRWHVDGSNGGYRIVDDEDAFETEAHAVAHATAHAAQYEEEQRTKIFQKEKDTRSWAWNASYHRARVKEAQKQIEYHTSKLNVAKIKAKEPEPA